MLATLRFLLGFSPVSFKVPPNESGKNSASSINSPFSDFLDSLLGMGMAFWPTLTVYETSGQSNGIMLGMVGNVGRLMRVLSTGGALLDTRGTCASEVLDIPAVPVRQQGLRWDVPEPEAEMVGIEGGTDGETDEGPAVGRCCWTAA